MKNLLSKKVVSIMLATLMILGVLSGCTGGDTETPDDEPADTPEGETSVLYSNGGPEEFFETPWLNPGHVIYNKTLFDHLLEADENLAPLEGEGKLAESYELSEDGMDLSFVLRDDVLWHDGEEITMDDVKWSIEYALQIAGLNAVIDTTFNAIEGAAEFVDGTADNVAGITVDGKNLDIAFKELAPDALLTFTQFAPLPQASFEGHDPLNFQQSSYWQKPIGSGPFMVDEVELNDYATLKPFNEYYGGAPEFSLYLTPNAGDSDPDLVTNAQSGMLDFAYTKSVEHVSALEELDNLTITQIDIRYTRLFFVNKFDKDDGIESPLKDIKTRQAIAYAIDMEAIAENLFEGAAIPANSLTPNEATKAEGLNDYAYDPEKAKELLAEANWDPETVLDVVYYYDDQQTVDFMAVIQDYLKDVGVEMEFRILEGDLGSLLWKPPADSVNGPSAVDWDMAYAANAAMSLHEYYDRYLTGYAVNSHTPSNPELDELIKATNETFDNEEIIEAFNELQVYENETLPSIPLYYQPVFLIESDKILKGTPEYGNPQFNYNWDIVNWDIAAE